jgi:hypothetical protein
MTGIIRKKMESAALRGSRHATVYTVQIIHVEYLTANDYFYSAYRCSHKM